MDSPPIAFDAYGPLTETFAFVRARSFLSAREFRDRHVMVSALLVFRRVLAEQKFRVHLVSFRLAFAAIHLGMRPFVVDFGFGI
jgi:hypothetical protein